MQAIGYRTSLPITDLQSLIALDLPIPEPGPRDLRVAAHALSVNPVDVKVRAGAVVGAERRRGHDLQAVILSIGGTGARDNAEADKPSDQHIPRFFSQNVSITSH